MLYPVINYLNHIWYILPEKSKLGDDFKVLKRKSFMGDLKKYGAMGVATIIDAYIPDLEKLSKYKEK